MSFVYRLSIITLSLLLFLSSIFLVIGKEGEHPESVVFSLCGFHQEGDRYFLEAKCVLQEKLPTLSLPEIVDLLWEEIIGFDDEYHDTMPTFTSFGARPLFAEKRNSLLD